MLMIQNDDALGINDHKPASIHTNSFYRHGKAHFDEFHVFYSEQHKEKFPTLALLLDTDIQQTKIFSR